MQSTDSPEPTDETDCTLTRRSATKTGAVILGLGGTGLLGYQQATSKALAVTAADYVVNSATAATDDGTITDITIGDETDADNAGIDINYEGLETAPQTLSFTLEARLGTDVGADTDGDDAYETLLTGSYEVSGTSGEESLDYSQVFPSSTVSLFDHTGIEAADFLADTDGDFVERTLYARITATATNTTATDEANNTLTVNNLAANSDVGGSLNTTISE